MSVPPLGLNSIRIFSQISVLIPCTTEYKHILLKRTSSEYSIKFGKLFWSLTVFHTLCYGHNRVSTEIWHQPIPHPNTMNQNWSEAAVPDSFLSPPSLNISYCQSGPHPTLMIGEAAQGKHTQHTTTTSDEPCSQTHTLNYCAVNQTGCNYLNKITASTCNWRQ